MSKLWGGRFTKETNSLVEKFSGSIHFDQALAQYDCIGSLKHIEVLKKAKLITAAEFAKLASGLKRILATIEKGTFKVDSSFEDIHSYIQHLLETDKSVGKIALKLHTCRSRNDQVLFDVKLYCLSHLLIVEQVLSSCIDTLRVLGNQNADLIMPGYTHLQHAMPVAVKDVCEAYAVMLERDETRLANAYDAIELTLGSGALAGTMIPAAKYSLPVKKGENLKEISAPDNSLATVADRDFVVEILSVLATIGMHLSRLSEDMILWASSEFDFINIDDAFCTGSSLMPQKKNPDVLELVRGYTGRLYGNLVNVLVMLKGLPLTYNRDMQHDKEPLFDSFKIIEESLAVMTALLGGVTFKAENLEAQVYDECLYATDIADFLVTNGVAFKEAHAIVGKLIQHKLSSGMDLINMSDEELGGFHKSLTEKVIKQIIDPVRSVQAKKSIKRS